MKNLLQSSVHLKKPEPDNQLSELFDNRASNPIHVNNVKLEGFQIEKSGRFGSPKEDQEGDFEF